MMWLAVVMIVLLFFRGLGRVYSFITRSKVLLVGDISFIFQIRPTYEEGQVNASSSSYITTVMKLPLVLLNSAPLPVAMKLCLIVSPSKRYFLHCILKSQILKNKVKYKKFY